MNPPPRPLRIAIADDPAQCRSLQKWLPSLGHQILVVAHTGRELIEKCSAQPCDLVITQMDLPGMDGIVASVELNRDKSKQVPFILVSSRIDAEILTRVGADHIMGFLTKPIKPVDLTAAIHFAVLRFEQYQKVLQESETLAQALANRKIIERAKGVLMKRAKLDERSAFRRLQQTACEKNQKLVEVAKMILIAEEAAQPEPPGRQQK